MKDKILIIDFLNFVYRGLISFGKRDESKPDYTIVFNFFRNLRALIEEFDPNRCYLVLEGNPRFRKELFPEYKANRIVKTGSKEADKKENVLRQADIISALSSLLPITQIRGAEYEADDTIYGLASNLKQEEVIIVSSDSDLIQILQDLSEHNIKLYNSRTKAFVSPPSYVYLVWKCLAGDKKTDNIPGICSAAKAEKLACSPPDLREFLSEEENRANFNLNKRLIELQLVHPEQFEITQPQTNYDALFAEFEKMELVSLLKEEYRQRFINTFDKKLSKQ